jgi:hypothetical protein
LAIGSIVREEEVGTLRRTRRSGMAEDAGKFVLFWDMRNGQNAIPLAAV